MAPDDVIITVETDSPSVPEIYTTALYGPKGDPGDKGDKGDKGDPGNGITQISKTSTSGLVDTYTIYYSGGSTMTFDVTNGEKGDPGDDGQDGISPTAEVTQTSGGATITITDAGGTTSANILNGVDGQDGADGAAGADGADGFSPIATVTKSGTVATITITDKNGTTTAEVYDGSGTGLVNSVNGETGDVVLTASDVGALPNTTTIPTDTSDLTNGAGYITSSALTPYELIDKTVNVLSTSGTIALTDNSISSITPSGNITFTLTTITDKTVFHEIMVQINLSTVYTVDYGTTYYFNKTAPDLSTAGTYNLYYEYDKATQQWYCGALSKGIVS